MKIRLKSQNKIYTNCLTLFQYSAFLLSLIIFTSCTTPSKDDNKLLSQWATSMLSGVSLTDQGNGTLLEAGSGKIWMKCTYGQTWNASLNNCTGTGGYTTYGAASLALCTIEGGCMNPTTLQANSGPAYDACKNMTLAGLTSWRLPTKTELLSLVGLQDRKTLLLIFPETPDDKYFWTGEQDTNDLKLTYGVSFAESTFGTTLNFDKVLGVLYVKCIR